MRRLLEEGWILKDTMDTRCCLGLCVGHDSDDYDDSKIETSRG